MTSTTSGLPAPAPYPELSERQKAVLQFLWGWPSPYPPSLREIGKAVGLSAPSAVRYHITELERKGWLRRHPRRPRALEVRQPNGRFSSRSDQPRTDYRRVPKWGLVPAGRPKEAVQVSDDDWELPAELVGSGELFLLRVRGDSMIDAAIVDGD